jgi:hypothetical protein
LLTRGQVRDLDDGPDLDSAPSRHRDAFRDGNGFVEILGID